MNIQIITIWRWHYSFARRLLLFWVFISRNFWVKTLTFEAEKLLARRECVARREKCVKDNHRIRITNWNLYTARIRHECREKFKFYTRADKAMMTTTTMLSPTTLWELEVGSWTPTRSRFTSKMNGKCAAKNCELNVLFFRANRIAVADFRQFLAMRAMHFTILFCCLKINTESRWRKKWCIHIVISSDSASSPPSLSTTRERRKKYK